MGQPLSPVRELEDALGVHPGALSQGDLMRLAAARLVGHERALERFSAAFEALITRPEHDSNASNR